MERIRCVTKKEVYRDLTASTRVSTRLFFYTRWYLKYEKKKTIYSALIRFSRSAITFLAIVITRGENDRNSIVANALSSFCRLILARRAVSLDVSRRRVIQRLIHSCAQTAYVRKRVIKRVVISNDRDTHRFICVIGYRNAVYAIGATRRRGYG